MRRNAKQSIIIVVAACCTFPGACDERMTAAATPTLVAPGQAAELQSAQQAFQRKQYAVADQLVRRLAAAEGFESLPATFQHDVLVLGARAALALHHPDDAQRLSRAATANSGAQPEDWLLRATADNAGGDFGDGALTLTKVAQQWPRALRGPAQQLVAATAQGARHGSLTEAADRLAQALFDIRWRLADGREPSGIWAGYALSLAEHNDLQRAAIVAAHVTDPYSLIAMRADRRFDRVLRAGGVQTSVKAAAESEISAAQDALRLDPDRLALINRVARALRVARRLRDAVALTDPVVARVRAAGKDARPFDDVLDQYPVLLDGRASALVQLGRIDEAVLTLREAVAYAQTRDSVGQALDLALLLCDLGLPEEARRALPATDDLSPFGRMVLALVQLDAASQLHDDAAIRRSLDYLQAHAKDAPEIHERALLIAGDTDAIAADLIARLTDPVERADALLGLQEFAPPQGPPRRLELLNRYRALLSRADVRAALHAVGRMESYRSINPP